MKRPFTALCSNITASPYIVPRPAHRPHRLFPVRQSSRSSFSSTSTVLSSSSSGGGGNGNGNNNNNNITFPFPSSSPSASPFNTGPSPPRLPREEQEIFEQLQRQQSHLTDAISTATTTATATIMHNNSKAKEEEEEGQKDEGPLLLHPDTVKGVQPEFEGDKNPKTGEIGGPKNEPLRWGATGEWTYSGRTTDF